MSDPNATPEQRVENLKKFGETLAQTLHVLVEGSNACSEPQTKRVLEAVRDTVAAVLFTTGCISGHHCDKCSETHVNSGVTMIQQLDQYVKTAYMLASMAKEAQSPKIPDPPKGTPVQ